MLVRSARIASAVLVTLSLAACSDAPLGGTERGSSGRNADTSSSSADPGSKTPAPSTTGTSTAAPPAPTSAAAPDAGATTPPAPTPVPAKLLLAPMHMHFPFAAVRGDWIMSLLQGEASPTYTYTGVQYKVLAVAPNDTRQVLSLYRCVDVNGTHFQSNLTTCEGAGTLEGRLGFVFAEDPGSGARPILRCIGPLGYPIVSTLERADCTGFIEQNITLGWAFPRDANP